MFGLDKMMAQAHLVSHLIVAAGSWMLEPGNPVMAKVPVAVQPELTTEIKNLIAERQQILDQAAKSK